MTDRELLERAAKAAGYNSFPGHANQMLESGWNPLNDDGDAFRLAAVMQLEVSFGLGGGSAYDDSSSPMVTELETENPTAAIRRAIVRAAAQDYETPT